jgi:uncharacterized protein (TIGR03083 family)
MLSGDTYHAALQRDAEAFVEVIRHGDLDVVVPDCPGWTLLDLARHLGGVHRWAFDSIVTGHPGVEAEGPLQRSDLVEWFADGAQHLLDLLRRSDPDAPTWTFGPPPRQVSFWSRRQALETAIHLTDARRALRREESIDAPLAADGIDEVVSMFFPRQVRLGRIPPLQSAVAITLDDDEREGVEGPKWVLAGDGIAPPTAIDASVSGPAVDVLLTLWGRHDVDGLRVQGDRAVVRAVFETALTP